MKRKHLHAVILVVSFLLAGIQPALATISVPTQTYIGNLQIATWDGSTYTLIEDVSEGLEITENNLTLDGDGHTVTGAGLGSGVHLSGRTGVTIKNLKVQNFHNGIHLVGCTGNTLIGNIALGTNAGSGILLSTNSSGNTLTDNTASNNNCGIKLYHNSNGNILTGNNISNNSWGIHLYSSNNNELTGNNVSENAGGIWLQGSDNNELTNNTSSGNSGNGIYIRDSSNNTLTNNTTSNNSWGIRIRAYKGESSTGNKIYNNNFENTPGQQAEVYAEDSGDIDGNVFNLDAPIGGNYWSDWTSPDVDPPPDGDGFVDDPYVFTGGQDNLPWTAPLNRPPVADAGEDQIVYAWIDCFAEVTLDGSGSNDPDGDELTLWSWTEDDLTYEATGVNPIDLPVGKHTIELIVNDGEEDSEPDEVVIDVIGPMKGDLCVFPPFISRYGPLKKILAALCLPCAIPEDQIDTDQPILLYPGGIKPTCTEVKKFTWRDKQYTCVFATFDKPGLMDATPDNGRVQLQLVGQIKTGQYFYGTDTVRIISWYWKRW